MATLILLRHGQSTYNQENRFTGWVDVDLTETGYQEAKKAGELLRNAGLLPDIVLTSVLKRSIYTTDEVLKVLDRAWVPVEKSWRLNERHYGGLAGLNKAETAERFGAEQVKIWRRSYDVRPPETSEEEHRHFMSDPRYRGLKATDVPYTEALADVLVRVMPYWEEHMVPLLREDQVVLVSAHGNSLRAMVKFLESIPDDEIVGYEIANGEPIVYELDGELHVASKTVL
ncbi:2,3-diphosphoglycerate-dependent phosphoglycerate mutase [Ferrimicrobium sp.]|uniref:2,3-diphosphoglycerate-dependent phosphoglycerate mutase n=1 Tax=Ferrimicrobium sp. TaxID=2926050 RepID=UPI00260F1CA0|nr:2,3-diphosphoglycerate-dependent phosphoglycerate mutase [Ferrimicrobium sp.]